MPPRGKALLVRRARQLLTLRGGAKPRRGRELAELGTIADGAILMRADRILAVGTTRAIEKLPEARGAHEVDARGRVVMPGFVDCHTHLVFGPPRLADYEMRLAGASYAEIAGRGGGILASLRAVRKLPAASLEEQARAWLRAMARHGTTTVEAKSGYGLDERAELKTLRVLKRLDGVAPTYLGAHVVPPEFTGRADGYIDWLSARLLPGIRRRRLADFVDIYCDTGAFTLEQARRYLTAAARLGFPLKIHAEQFARTGAAQLAVELKAVSADHLERVNGRDIQALARSQTMAVLLPGAVWHLGLGRYPPARALIEAGAAVALATDFNPGTSPTYSMQMVVALACTQMRMQPAEALAAATINSAHAIRRADRVGSLEAGKQADVIVLEVSDYREIPYYFGVNHVHLTIQRGRVMA